MKFDIAGVFDQAVTSFVKLPIAHKIALPVMMAGSVLTIMFVSNWASRPDYQVLYSGLEESDAASVVEKLKDQKVAFRLTDGGKTIEVSPPRIVPEMRLELASAGVPSGGKGGYELFNETNLGQTAFVEEIKLLRAQQGELERTIQSIDAVRSVRVHITNPKRSAFVKRDVAPTASVLLKLKAGSELTPQQIKGIANLVAGSVERLTPENVTIIDTKGNTLNSKKDNDVIGGADVTRIEYQRKIEKGYEEQIESMLAEVLGPGKAVARVTADLDFSKYEKEEESYDPGGQVTRSERSIEEAAGASAEGGVPGVVSNLTNDPGLLTPPDSSKGNNRRRESVKNFELSRAVSRTVSAAGKVNRITVAVLVDGQYIEGAAAAEGKTAPAAAHIYRPLNNEMLRKIEGLVKQSVGFDPARGDVVTIENMQFMEPDQSLEEAIESGVWERRIASFLPWLLTGLFLVLFFMILIKPLVKFLFSPTDAEVDLSRLLPAGIGELEAELEAERVKLSTLPDMGQASVNIEELEELLAENSRLVRESPQQAALLIRYWLNDGRI